MAMGKLMSNVYARLIPATIILIIIIGGSIQSYIDFLSQNIWLNLAVVALSLLYIVFTNIEKLKTTTASTPNFNENFFVSSEVIKVEKLNQRSDLLAIHKLAKKEFGADSMTLEKIQDLHWHMRNTVFLLKDEIGDVIGYLAIFIPTQELKDGIFQGESFFLNPMNWEASLLQTSTKASIPKSFYLESIVVEARGPRMRNIRSKFLIREALESILDEIKSTNYEGSIHLFGFVGSEKGRNLMSKSLQLQLIRKKANEEEMDLMESLINIDDLKKIWLNLDRQLIKSAYEEKDLRILK